MDTELAFTQEIVFGDDPSTFIEPMSAKDVGEITGDIKTEVDISLEITDEYVEILKNMLYPGSSCIVEYETDDIKINLRLIRL